jgi:hypothetical protein
MVKSLEEFFIDLVKYHLQANEKEALGVLSISQEINKSDDIAMFSEHDEKVQDLAKDFFDSHYHAVQVLDCALDRGIILKHVEDAVAKLSKLEKSLEKDMKALCTLKRFDIRLQDALKFIGGDKLSPEELFSSYKDKIFQIEDKAGKKKLKTHRIGFFELMPGANNLLNYQISKILEINRLLSEELNRLIEQNHIEEVILDNVNQQELDEFLAAVKGEKILAHSLFDKLIREANLEAAYNQANLNSIGNEYAINFLYRLAWDGRFSLVPA